MIIFVKTNERYPFKSQRFVASLRVRDLRDGGGDHRASSVYWLHEEILDESVTLRSGMGFHFDLGILSLAFTRTWQFLDYFPLVRLNRTLDEHDDDGEDKEGVGVREQVQDICAYSRHQGLGHKISGT